MSSSFWLSDGDEEGEGGSDIPTGVPVDLPQAVTMIEASVTSFVKSGQRGMTVDLLTPDLNPASRGYDREAVKQLLIGMVRSLLELVAGEIQLVLDNDAEADAADEGLRESISLATAFGEDRIKISSLVGDRALVLPSGTPDWDVLVLMGPTNGPDRKVTKEVRALLQASSLGAVTLVVNQALDAPGPPDGRPMGTLPIEIEDFESVFFLEPLALQAQPQGMAPSSPPVEDAPAPPAPLRIALVYAHPGKWGVWSFEEDDQRYVLEREYPKKPSKVSILEVAKDIIKARRG